NLGANHLKKYSEHGNFKTIFANALLTEALLAFGAGLPVRIIGESLDLELLGPLHDNFSITVDSDFLEKIFAGLQHIAGNVPKDIQDKFTRIEEGSKDALEWERMIRGES
ncbi:MAG: hypothetical protein HUU01_04240, partial [Saprospiraceae bacterium]|nr:hypothetical protein [Saprospiraceae bacterium]